MENASKALLIAAAVLIVILLVAFGMKVFNDSADMGDEAEQLAGTISSGIDSGNRAIIYSDITKIISGLEVNNANSKKQITAKELRTLVEKAKQYNALFEKKEDNIKKIYIGVSEDTTRTVGSAHFITTDQTTLDKINKVLEELYKEPNIYIKLKSVNSLDEGKNGCKITILCADSLDKLDEMN